MEKWFATQFKRHSLFSSTEGQGVLFATSLRICWKWQETRLPINGTQKQVGGNSKVCNSKPACNTVAEKQYWNKNKDSKLKVIVVNTNSMQSTLAYRLFFFKSKKWRSKLKKDSMRWINTGAGWEGPSHTVSRREDESHPLVTNGHGKSTLNTNTKSNRKHKHRMYSFLSAQSIPFCQGQTCGIPITWQSGWQE